MKILFRFFCIMSMLLLFFTSWTGFSDDALAKSKKKKVQHRQSSYTPPNAYIIIDADTGMVISQSDADRTLYPASLTKLMTLALTFEAINTGKISSHSSVTMSSHAASMPPSRLGVRPGNSITVDTAIKALVTKSANDVAVALGERLGGSESRFAQIMNLKARELGMSQTHFANASGLHNTRQRSSPRDMAKLALYILHQFPNHYPVFATREFYFGGKSHHNHNRLMDSYRGMDGMKTGYVSQSGFNLVASAKRGNVRLIGVVFGGRTANSRNAQMASLLDDGFARIQQLRLMRPQIAQATPPVSSSPQRHKTVTTPEKPTTLARADSYTESAPAPAPRKNVNTQQILEPTNPNHSLGTLPSPSLTAKVGSYQQSAQQSSPTLSANAPTAAAFAPPQEPPLSPQGSSWGIQIGAFQDRVSTDQAIYSALRKLPSPLNRGNAMIVPLRTAEATWVFRARIIGYTKEQAMEACRHLDDCLTISPSAN